MDLLIKISTIWLSLISSYFLTIEWEYKDRKSRKIREKNVLEEKKKEKILKWEIHIYYL